jgi:hypothetical protein
LLEWRVLWQKAISEDWDGQASFGGIVVSSRNHDRWHHLAAKNELVSHAVLCKNLERRLTDLVLQLVKVGSESSEKFW